MAVSHGSDGKSDRPGGKREDIKKPGGDSAEAAAPSGLEVLVGRCASHQLCSWVSAFTVFRLAFLPPGFRS